VSRHGALPIRLSEVGLDLFATTRLGLYNEAVDGPFRLPGGAADTVAVVGNTAALWPHIDRYVMGSPNQVEHPVDNYVEAVVRDAVAGLPEATEVRFSHEPPPRRIAIQRLAHLAGLAWLSPSHLCVHPEFGPWIALRAAIVLDTPYTGPETEPAPPCDCATHCLPMLESALELGEPANGDELAERWRAWLAVRDACPVGRRHRYPDEQIRYHYTGEWPDRWRHTAL
jgi:cyanocobalamin reductase (cyanide-eliminating) / alkylcobalamin dealkylase